MPILAPSPISRQAIPWFDSQGQLTRRLPPECIRECSAQGSVDSAVAYWQPRLSFNVPRHQAIPWLRSTGGWDLAELTLMSDAEISQKVLWLACCDLRETGDWFGLF